jgi:hypothetical protein
VARRGSKGCVGVAYRQDFVLNIMAQAVIDVDAGEGLEIFCSHVEIHLACVVQMRMCVMDRWWAACALNQK